MALTDPAVRAPAELTAELLSALIETIIFR